MTVATPRTELLSPPDHQGRRYFTVSYVADDWNDVDVRMTDFGSLSIFKAAKRVVHFSGLEFIVTGTVGVLVSAGFDWIGSALVMGEWLTTKASDTSGYIPVDLTVPADAIRTPDASHAYWLILTTSGYAATDDMSVMVWGWIE